MKRMDKNSPNVTINISTSTIVTSILFVVLFALLFFIRDLVLVVLTAIVLASAIEPGARWFMHYKVPRIAAVLLIYVAVFAVFFGILSFFLPVLLDDASGLFSQLPVYLDSIIGANPGTEVGSAISETTNGVGFSLQNIIQEFQALVSNSSVGFVTILSFVFGGVLSFILIVVFSFYFAVQETGVDDFLRIVTPVKQQDYIIDLWQRSKKKIGRWMQGQLILALIIGVLTYLGLTIFGVPYAILLALLAMLFEIIPVFGPILAAIPAVGVAFLDGGATLGFLVVGLYLIIQQFENNLIYPLVVKKVVGVPPLLVILALIIGAKVAGFLGIILSVPVAAVLQEFVHDIQVKKGKQFEKKSS